MAGVLIQAPGSINSEEAPSLAVRLQGFVHKTFWAEF